VRARRRSKMPKTIRERLTIDEIKAKIAWLREELRWAELADTERELKARISALEEDLYAAEHLEEYE
jgi:hypothetical protein